jgi:uncharacterized protein (DUF934 family)
MPLLIDRQPVTDDSWRQLDDDTAQLPAGQDLIVPLARFEELSDALARHDGRIAPLVTGDDDLTPLLDAPQRFAMIAVEFPVFRDGRGFSIARILRRAGYTGQLRAVGHVARDQLGYLERCGFDAFAFSDEVYAEHFLNAFDEISVRYQGCADDPRPIYLQN